MFSLQHSAHVQLHTSINNDGNSFPQMSSQIDNTKCQQIYNVIEGIIEQ